MVYHAEIVKSSKVYNSTNAIQLVLLYELKH